MKFDENKSVLPKRLLKRGVGIDDCFSYTEKRKLISEYKSCKREIEKLRRVLLQARKKLDNESYKVVRRFLKLEIEANKKWIRLNESFIRNFQIVYFNANDVEKAFRKR